MFLPIARRLNRKAARSAKVNRTKMRAKFFGKILTSPAPQAEATADSQSITFK